MELGIGMSFICFAIAYKLFIQKKHKSSEYLSEQADRYFNKMCEDNGSTEGRVKTKGLALIKTSENEYTFVKQSKLCDTSILY